MRHPLCALGSGLTGGFTSWDATLEGLILLLAYDKSWMYVNVFPDKLKHIPWFAVYSVGPSLLRWLERLGYFLNVVSLRLRITTLIIERSQSSITLHGSYGLFSDLGKCLPHVFNLVFRWDSARLLGSSTHPLLSLVTHYVLLITHRETGDSDLPILIFST